LKFIEEDNKTRVAWISALTDAIEAFSLNSMIEENIQHNNKDFVILQAKYGKLSRDDHTIDITQTLREIVINQGGDQLLLNAGSKESIFGVPKKTKSRQILISYSFNGNIYTNISEDSDPVRIGKAA